MNPAASRLFCPRLSEASRLLPLIRRYLVAAAPRSLATTIKLLPIVQVGLFGYELVSACETHIYPIIGCNANGEPVLRKNSYGVDAAHALRLVAVDGRLHSRSGRATRNSIPRPDSLFPNWLAAAESAWAQLVPLFPDLPRQTPVLDEIADPWLDKALVVAHSHLVRWDPFIEFFGLPKEEQMGFALSGACGEHGELVLHQPDTWTLRWNAPPEVVCESWSLQADGPEAANDSEGGYPRSLDRRARCRRATDRGWLPDSCAGTERRQRSGRRAVDQHA
jgi:hypothetical protein